MENWKNLDKILTLNVKDLKEKELNAQKLVEYAENNDKLAIQKLLKNGAILNCFADHLTPLISTVKNNFFELGVFLLNAGASISYKKNEKMEDALWITIKNKNHLFLKEFIDRKCKLSLNAENQTPLIYTTIQSDVKSVELLLSHYKINVNQKDGEGNTALHHNVKKENPSQDDLTIGKLLLAAGADQNSRNIGGRTPIEEAENTDYSKIFNQHNLEQKMDAVIEEKGLENENKVNVKKKFKI